MKKMYKLFYVFLFILPFFLFLMVPFRGQKSISVAEARTLQKIPHFSIKSFAKGDYQDQLEKAISDQLILSSRMKKINNRINGIMNRFVVEKVIDNTIKPKTKQKMYVSIYDGFYKYGDSDYIIEKPKNNSDYNYSYKSAFFNNIKGNKYIYFIEKDRSVDFNNIEEKESIYKNIKKNYNAEHYARFEINSFDDYKKYFYQTDHHWNKEGQLKGYQEIVKFLLGDEEATLKPIKEVTYDVIFYGSSDRKMQTKYSTEKFSVYKYPELKYKVHINGEEKPYSFFKKYDDGLINKSTYTNHYAYYYGGDFAEVVYDFNQPKKKNLLVLCTSYSNSIKDLLASHFNKTYYIDVRHYPNFDPNKYIDEHDIDMVLMMGDITSFTGGGE